MKNLWNDHFFPSDVEAATDGYCSARVQQTWVARNMFLTSIPEPRTGKPREFPLTAVFEAAILSAGVQFGLGLRRTRAAILWCYSHDAHAPSNPDDGEDREGFESEVIFAATRRGAFYDYSHFDIKNPWFWWVVMERDLGLHDTENGGFMGGVIISQGHGIPKALPKLAFAYRFPVTRIIAHVAEVLTERLEERGDTK